MLDRYPRHVMDLGHANRDEPDMIMAKSRLVSSGGCNEVVVEGFGGGGVAEGAAGG
jgi:hypothetical protein